MLAGVRSAVDSLVQRRSPLGFLYAILKKFGEDRAGQLAALVAYFGFFSLFPLLLFFVTILGIVLRNNAELQGRVLGSALAQFPIIGDQIRENVHSISRSGVALGIGLGGALWGGLGGIKAMQNAMDRVWAVPYRRQPGFVPQLVRGALMLIILGIFILVGTGLAGLGAVSGSIPGLGRALTFVASAVVDTAVFLLAFKILTVAEESWSDVVPGAVIAGVAWAALQAVGNFYIGRELKGSSQLYGFFGIVIGLLSWLYLASQITLIAAEVNVVRKYSLWPRSLGVEPVTPADRSALELYARVEERSDRQRVAVEFDGPTVEQ